MTDRERALYLFQKARKAQIFKGADYVQCPYCGRAVEKEWAVAVHYIPRGKRATEVEPDNVWVGHAYCNSKDQQESGQGESHEAYREWLIHKVGLWKVMWLENRSKVTVKHGKSFYQELAKECEEFLKEQEEGL